VKLPLISGSGFVWDFVAGKFHKNFGMLVGTRKKWALDIGLVVVSRRACLTLASNQHHELDSLAKVFRNLVLRSEPTSIFNARIADIDMGLFVGSHWPNRPDVHKDLQKRWLHGDLRNMAYVHTFRLYDDWVMQENLDK
jgi:hypothetical protein